MIFSSENHFFHGFPLYLLNLFQHLLTLFWSFLMDSLAIPHLTCDFDPSLLPSCLPFPNRQEACGQGSGAEELVLC